MSGYNEQGRSGGRFAGLHTQKEISDALNWAADAICEAAELPDAGTRDALNLLVNAVGQRLFTDPEMTLEQVAASCYETYPEDHGYDEDDSEAPLKIVLDWINE